MPSFVTNVSFRVFERHWLLFRPRSRPVLGKNSCVHEASSELHCLSEFRERCEQKPSCSRVVSPNIVAVGTVLHRCRLGPPPAQIPASGTTALGSHLGSWRRSARQATGAGFSRAVTTGPRAWSFASSSAGSLASLSQALHPRADDFGSETPDGLAVRRHRVVREVPTEDCAEPSALLTDWFMSAPRHDAFQRLERGPHPRRVGMPGERKPPPLRPSAAVDQPEETESLRRATVTSLEPVRVGESAELDEACLVRVQFQSELAESLPQVFEEPPPISLALEAHHEVIRVAHDNDVAVSVPLPPLVGPQVEWNVGSK